MNKQGKTLTGLAFGKPHPLRAAVRCALVQQRSAITIGAGLVALGLATQPVLAAPFPAAIELSSLAAGNGSKGFVLNGIDVNDFSGLSVSAAGDLNGDGIDDVVVSAANATPSGRRFAGES